MVVPLFLLFKIIRKEVMSMVKVNNAVRIVEFETEDDLYAQMENDLVSCFNEPDSRCYKLKNIQILNENHAILYFEEDINTIMVRFIYNKEVLRMEEAPDDISYFTIQEISLLNDLGMVTIDDTTYDIEEIEYVMDMYGVRHADIYLN